MKTGILLLILDGFGIGSQDVSNPIYISKMKNLHEFFRRYPFGILQASGTAVGLYWNEAGNCEVGHFTIGTGRAVLQDYVRALEKVRDENFFSDEKLNSIFDFAKFNSSNVHIIAPLSLDFHNCPLDVFKMFVEFAKRSGARSYFHLISDGYGQEFLKILQEVESLFNDKVKIATIIGGRYAFDKERSWLLRTKIAFDLITKGEGKKRTLEEFKKNLISNFNLKDLDIEPTVINEVALSENDVLIFLALKEDEIFQLAKSILDEDFNFFPRNLPQNLNCLTMVDLPIKEPKYQIEVYLEKINIQTSLIRELFLKEKNVFKITETSRAVPLNFYFNGKITEAYPNEYRKIIPPTDIYRDFLSGAREIADNIVQAIIDGIYDLIIANIPVTDIVGHTGDINLAVKLLSELDELLKDLFEKTIAYNWMVIFTSDHGNIERMTYLESGKVQKIHDPNPVPFLIVKKGFEREKTEAQFRYQLKTAVGTLADITPTILWFFDIPKPDSMLGKNLTNFIY